MAGKYIYRLMDAGTKAVENEEPLHSNTRKIWLDGAPPDVLQIEFRDGSRKSLETFDEDSPPKKVVEPLTPADGSYWADLSAKERRAFYWKDIRGVRSSLSHHVSTNVCPSTCMTASRRLTLLSVS